jgi:hypothetical protein
MTPVLNNTIAMQPATAGYTRVRTGGQRAMAAQRATAAAANAAARMQAVTAHQATTLAARPER